MIPRSEGSRGGRGSSRVKESMGVRSTGCHSMIPGTLVLDGCSYLVSTSLVERCNGVVNTSRIRQQGA